MSKVLKKLKEHFSTNKDIKQVNIFLHSNPDPDSISSAMGLDRIIRTWSPETKCTFIYSGEISHSQNKTLVNVLSIPLVHLNDFKFEEPETSVNIAVDTIPERSMPEEYPCLAAIDHHRSDSKRAEITDIREVGSTAAIIWDYMQKEKIVLDKNAEQDANIATAMLIGIKTDTMDLVSENVKNLDFDAYKSLISIVNRRYLSLIINYSIPSYLFSLRSKLDAEENFRIGNGVFVGGVGCIPSSKRDSLPTMAEERARVEGIETSFVFAIVDEHIEVSMRSVGASVDVNAICHKIFGKDVSGGKMGSGAAKIPMGFFDLTNTTEEIRERMWNSVKDFMIDKIFKVMV